MNTTRLALLLIGAAVLGLGQPLPSASQKLTEVFPHRLRELRATDIPARSNDGRALAGIHRKAPENLTGRWDVLDDGRRIWRMAIDSPGAAGWRVHFTGFAAGAGRVWVHDGTGAASEIGGPYTGHGPYGDGDFWSGVVLSDRLVIEYEAQDSSDALPFTIEQLSQMLPDSPIAPNVEGKAGAATRNVSASCNLDVNCHAEWAETKRSVGHVVFEDAGSSFVCSGTLLATRNNSGIPYFLTADHCISSDTVARTTQTFWAYETRACNGTPPNRRDSQRVLGARYLAGGGRAQGDFTLLRLTEAPANATFSTWNPDDVADGAAVTVIHHPSGDYKRISFGNRTTPRAGLENFYRVRYTQGVTEGGSSGSGLFSRPGVLVGLLSSGPKADTPEGYCTINPFVDNFGKFSAAFGVLRDFLEDRTTTGPPAPPPTSEPIRLNSGASQAFTIESVQDPVLLNGSRSYAITVPEGAVRLEIQLTTTTPNADVDLFARHGSDPAISGGSVVADHRSTGATGNETIVISSGSSPALRPGTYFISLAMFTTGLRATGTIQATVFTSGPPLPPPAQQDSNLLVSGTPQNFSFAARDRATLLTGANSYRINVPEGATRLEIRLTTTTPNVDVDLFARFGVDTDLSGNNVVADHRSEGLTGNETIVITSATSPALRAGTYFISLAVFTTGVAFQGSILATVTAGSTPPPSDNPIALVSARPQNFRFDPVTNPTLFTGARSFTIAVPQGATRLELRLVTDTPNADVDLFARFGTEPRVSAGEVTADHSSTGTTGNETIVITPSSTPTLRAGTYHISLAVFTTGVTVSGQLTATVGSAPAPPAGGPTVLSSGVPGTFRLGAVDQPTLFRGANGFVIDVPQNARALVVQLTTATAGADVDLYVRHDSEPAVSSGDVTADFSSTGPTGAESITITPSSTPALRPGRYFIALAQFTTGLESTGTVRATITTETSPGPPPTPANRRLLSGVPVRFQLPSVDTATLFRGDQSYTVEVPEGASRLTVQLTSDSPSIDVDLFVRRGEDVGLADGEVITDYESAGITGNETLVITPSSRPSLRGGTYFISLALFTKGVPASGTITATVERGVAPPPTSSARTIEIGGEARLNLASVTTPTIFGGQDAFRIVVPASAEGIQVVMTAQPSNVDLDLFLRFGAEAEVVNGRVVADHSSVSVGGSEAIVVNRTSSPPLRAGVYFVNVGVFTTGVASTATISVSAPRSSSELQKSSTVMASESGEVLNAKPPVAFRMEGAVKEAEFKRSSDLKKLKYRDSR